MAGLLDRERDTLERFLPGFDRLLAETPLEELERRDGDTIETFRQTRGPALLVPAERGGLGASPLEATEVQQAIGSRAPSLAVATTMHHFSVAGLIGTAEEGEGLEWVLLEGIADGSRLLASGFAEGIPGQGVFKPTMTARRVGDHYLVNGAKRPCSLARSMDILTASVEILDEHHPRFAVAMIAANLPGIEIEPFWEAPVLTGAQSEAVILRDVAVESALVVEVDTVENGFLATLQAKGLLWFELLMTASYLGIAKALVQRAIDEDRGDPSLRTVAAAELETVTASLEGIALRMSMREDDNWLLSRALCCRYAAQDAITRAVAAAVEQLGGMAFIRDPSVPYYATASRALALHPPSRARVLPMLAKGLVGEGLEIA